MSFPTGTVTFLFTDIEGSSQRWEAYREAMHVALVRHDALVRAAIEEHNGFVFKTVGDAFCAAFASGSDALSAAIDAQRALYAAEFSTVGGLRVRMGIHSGAAFERADDYFGPAVNRVARLMSIGHGGQVLLSAAARELVCSDLPDGTSLIDLGSHRLKDLAESEHVWQLAIADVPSEFPELNSLDAFPNNLPIQITPLRGREHDLEQTKSALADYRLLTLVGPGGVGKTRLALQTAAEVLERFPDGVWFAEFAPVDDPELVSSIVAKVLRISQAEGCTVGESIAHWLAQKRSLIVLDNCEHVLPAVVQLVETILTSSPNVSILATSRQTFGVRGEVVYQVPVLAVPAEAAGLKAEEALQFGAVTLFVDRAVASDMRFSLTDENAPTVADICCRLDGIPLAIELAAARVKVLSIPNLAHRLDERFKILTGGSRTAMPRQQTMSALIDWSYNLLTSQEQTVFNRLGVFAGGFSLESVTAVCSGGEVSEGDVFDVLASLVDKSLVVAKVGLEHERYSLLESTRAYALQKLTSIDECQGFTQRHAEHFSNMARKVDQESCNMPVAAVLARLAPEMDNFRATLDWALREGHDIALGAALAGALEQLWFDGGLSAEGRHWISMALEQMAEGQHPAIAGRLWLALGLLFSGKRKYECGDRARGLYESVGDRHGAAHALRSLARGLIQMGRLDEAVEASTHALDTFRELGDRQGQALSLNELADIAGNRGDVDAARVLYEETLTAFRTLGDETGKAIVLADLAELEFGVGNLEHALRNVQEAIEIDSRGKNATNLAIEYSNSAAYRIALGDLDGARDSARQGLRHAQRVQSGSKLAWVLQHFALIAGLRSELSTAARLLSFVDSQYVKLGLERESTERWGCERLTVLLREKMSTDEIKTLAAEGATWSEDEAVQEALKV